MKVQDMINELQTILKEHGNLEIVAHAPHGEGVSHVGIYAEDAEKTNVWSNSGYWKYPAVKVCVWEN